MGVLLRALVLRWLARHRARTALGIVAVALGVAAFIASVAVGDAIGRSGSTAVASLLGGADLSVEGDDAGLDARLLSVVEQVDGVRAAVPLLQGWARVRRGGADESNAAGATVPSGRGRALVIGIDPLREQRAGLRGDVAADAEDIDPARAFAFISGMAGVLGERLAAELGVVAGDPIEVVGPSGRLSLIVAHVSSDARLRRASQGRVLVLTLAATQQVFGRPAQMDRIDVALADGAVPATVRDGIERALVVAGRTDAYVGPPRLQDSGNADVMHVTNVGLRVGAGVALLIGMFLIHHTLAVGVAERRREIGVLRALGATRSQVRRVFAGEAIVLGLAGSTLGVGLAWLLAQGALQGFASAIAGAYFPSEPEPVQLAPGLVAAGIGIGTAVAWIAALVPAARAAASAPSDAIRRGPEGVSGTRSVSRTRIAVAAALGVLGAVAAALPPRLGAWTSYATLLLVLVAFVLAAPLILASAARALAPLLARIGGVPGRLAADDLARHPRRAALPAAALAFGIALVVETVGTLDSVATGALRWMEDQVAGELFVSAGTPVMGIGNNTPLLASSFEPARSVPGVRASTPLRMRVLPFRDTRVLAMGFDFEGYRAMQRLDVIGMEADAAFARLSRGGSCLVSTNFVVVHGLDQGDVVRLTGPSGPFELKILGAFEDFSWPRGTVLVDRSEFVTHLGDDLVDEVSLVFEPGVDQAEVTARIDAALGDEHAFVLTRADDLRGEARALLEELFALAYSQVGVAYAVAFLGVLNTLWIAVVLRRRELGLLRAVGGTRGQLITSIVLEAAALGVIGAVLGVAGGLLIQWVALARFLPADSGWLYPFVVPLGAIAAIAVLGVVTSALAGVIPARMAARVPVREAIGYE